MRIPLPVFVLLISSVGWGLIWLPLRYFEQAGLAGPLLIFIAFSCATLFLLPGLFRQRHAWFYHIGPMLLIVLCGGVANLAFQAALYYGDVVRVMILFYLLPVWSVLGGRLFLGEPIDLVRIVALLASIGGGFMILGGMMMFTRPPDWVDLVAILSGFAFAMNNLLFRATQSIPLISKVAAVFFGVTMFTGLFLLVGDTSTVMPAVHTGLVAAAYGVFWLMLITFGTQWAVTRMEAGRSAIIMVMELVAAVVSSVILLDHFLSSVELAGAFLVTTAALLEGTRGEQDAIAQVSVEEASR